MSLPLAMSAVALAAGFTLAPSRQTEPEHKLPTPGIHKLTQLNHALRVLYLLQLTPEQMQSVQKIARYTMAADREYKKPKVSEDYRSLLTELQRALVDASDGERIEDLEERVNDLQESENPEIDDSFEITAEARKRAPEVLRALRATQIATFLGAQCDELLDPLDELLDALQSIRELKEDEWKASRDELAEQVAWAVTGLDTAKAKKLYEDVGKLLNTARGLSASDFKKKKASLEKRARKLAGGVAPTDVLRHHVEKAIAEVLSNPCLDEALKKRLAPER